MDMFSTYKEKVNSFRIKELKEVLTRLGLPKQGKRQDLVDRIVNSLSVEAKKNIIHKGEVAGIVEDVFRKLQSTEATSSSIKEESLLEIDLNPKAVIQKKISCPCGSPFPTEPMIQCADPHCGVLQHMPCVIVPEELSEEHTPTPWRHYCEICRLNRADPFRVTVTHLLPPVKLMASSIPDDGSNPVQSVEKAFQLNKTDKNYLRHNEYNIQAWCMLLNDKVQFRMQWPLYADLKVNGVPVRTVTRPGSQLLGANGRDDGSMVAFYMVDGLNQISLSGWDARSFCFGVRIVKEKTVKQILELILHKQGGESFDDAMSRIQRCIGGGMAMATEDSDSDLEVISDFVTVSLRCPMGGYRIKTAGRFRPCAHMGCFDLETFVQLNQRSRKWQCPICLKNYSLEDISVDPYFNYITKMVEDCEEDVTEIDVKFNGSWRVKKGNGFKNLDQWRLPDGCLRDSTPATFLNSTASDLLKVDGVVGHIDDKKLREVQTTSRHQQGTYFECFDDPVIAMKSSSSESHRVGDHNANQNAVLPNSNVIARPIVGNSSAASSDLDIIVLSDSDEETPSLMYPKSVSTPETVYDVVRLFSAIGVPHLVSETLPCDVGLSSASGISSCKDNNIVSQQTFSSGTQTGSEFQPIHTLEVMDASGDAECSTEDLTSFGCGSNSDVNGASMTHHEALSLGGQDLVKQCKFTQDLSVGRRVRSKLTVDREQSNGPFAFPRRARSARQTP